jgi:hypothetical protein
MADGAASVAPAPAAPPPTVRPGEPLPGDCDRSTPELDRSYTDARTVVAQAASCDAETPCEATRCCFHALKWDATSPGVCLPTIGNHRVD